MCVLERIKCYIITKKLSLFVPFDRTTFATIDHFTVMCLVARSLNESESGVDLGLLETSFLFSYKFLLISIRTASLT